MILSEDLVLYNNWVGIIDDSPFSSDDDDQDEWEDIHDSIEFSDIPIKLKSKSNPFRVSWISNRSYPKTHHNETDFTLLDRSLCMGDVITYKSQLATVLNVNCFYDILDHKVWLDIDNFSEYILQNVPSTSIYRDHEFLLNEYCFYKNHMGTLEDVESDCIVLVQHLDYKCLVKCDSSLCVPNENKYNLQFETTLPSHNKPIHTVFKHGYNNGHASSFLEQDNRGICMGTFINLSVLLKSNKDNQLVFLNNDHSARSMPEWFNNTSSSDSALVIAIIPRFATINWMIHNPFCDESEKPYNRINCSDNDLMPLIPLSLRKNYCPGTYVKIKSDFYEIINVRSYCDIELQSGTILRGIKSTELFNAFVNEEDYLPSDFVVDKQLSNSLGIVISVNHSDRISNVKWYENGFNYGRLLPDVEQKSIFDLKNSDTFLTLCSPCFIPPSCIPIFLKGDLKLSWFAEISKINRSNGLLCFKFYNGIEIEMDPTLILPFVEQEQLDEEEEWTTDEDVESHEASAPATAALGTAVNDVSFYTDSRDSQSRVIIEDEVPSDHHYISSRQSRKILKRWNMEIELLKSNLTPGILVKSYEQRVDLMRVEVIGAKDTPYEDALFFFDIHLQEDYPFAPPEVFYKSFSDGKQLNPNLFDNGQVCISLLNTTNGESFEMWNKDSNLLQLFISIQSLILTRDPFWNEPMHWRIMNTSEGDRSKMLYWERTIIGSIASIINVCKKPVMGFENEIKSHFNDFGGKQRTIKRIKEYLKGELALGFKQSLERLLKELENNK